MKPNLIIVGICGLLLAACNSDPSTTDTDPDAGTDPSGTEYQYVQSALDLPNSSAEYALDLDGDGHPDNALGGIFGIVATYFDMQAQVDASIETGVVVILHSVLADSLTADDSATWQVYMGDAFEYPNVPDFSGNGSFTISSDYETDSLVSGTISAGMFTGGPAEVQIAVTLVEGQDPVPVNLVGAHIEADVSDSGCEGTLAGAMTEEELNENVLPAMVAMMNDTISQDPGCPDACEGEGAAFMLSFFDSDDDGVITLEELTSNDLISGALAPDVDLFDDTGAFNPGVDDVNDAVSLGTGMTCVPGSFESP